MLRIIPNQNLFVVKSGTTPIGTANQAKILKNKLLFFVPFFIL